MEIYIVLEYSHLGFSEILGAFSTLEKAEKRMKEDFNVWGNEARKIVKVILDK